MDIDGHLQPYCCAEAYNNEMLILVSHFCEGQGVQVLKYFFFDSLIRLVQMHSFDYMCYFACLPVAPWSPLIKQGAS